MRIDTKFRWVNGNDQLADAMTKSCSRRVIHQFLAGKQIWKLVFDEKFTAGRKLRKKELIEKLDQAQVSFVADVHRLAEAHNWPTDHLDLKNRGDASIQHDFPPWFHD